MKKPASRIYELPWPPSVNNYWRAVVNKKTMRPMFYVADAGKRYVRDVEAQTIGCRTLLEGPLRVTIWVYLPDRRTRDLDNLLKAILDACTRAGLWSDDKQIRDLRIAVRGMHRPHGKIVLRAGEIEKTLF